MLLDIFVTNDWLDCRIRIVDQKLVDCLQRHLRLLVVVIRVQAQDRLIVFGITLKVLSSIFGLTSSCFALFVFRLVNRLCFNLLHVFLDDAFH